MFNLLRLRSKKTARMQKESDMLGCVWNVARFCAEWSCKNNDLTVLRLLAEAAGGKDLATNSHNCAITLFNKSYCDTSAEPLDNLRWNRTINYECCVLYDVLYYFCHYGSVNLARFLVKLGLDVYKDCVTVGFPFYNHPVEAGFVPLQCFRSDDFHQLHYAFYCCSPLFPKTFVKTCKCDEFCNRNYVLALFWAAINSNIDVLKYLLTIVEKKEFYKRYQHCHSSLYVEVSLHMQFEPLHLFLKAGFHIETFCPPKQDTQSFLNLCILNREKASVDTLKTLVVYGAVEFMFGCHNSTTPFMQYLINIWNKTAQRMQGLDNHHAEQHENSQTTKIEMPICVEKFGVLLKHLGLFMFIGDHGYYIEQAVPTMKQLCRYVIRCCIIKECKTLHYVHELPIPASLKSYLCRN